MIRIAYSSMTLLVLISISSTQLDAALNEPRLVCYFAPWAMYRAAPWNYTVDSVPANKCTHIMYSFALLDGNTFKLYNNNPASGAGSYSDFLRLRDLSPMSKLMLSIGGWEDGQQNYSNMALTSANRATFIASVLDTMEQYDRFDGIDLDWEFPGVDKNNNGSRGGRVEDKANFVILLQELRGAVEDYKTSTRYKKGRKLELSIAAPIDDPSARYDVSSVCQALDFVNMMAYGLRGSWNKYTDVSTPLYTRPELDVGAEKSNLNDGIGRWSSLGCPKNKLVVGMGFYGQTYTLSSPSNYGLHATATGDGKPGASTRMAGTLAYYEFCQEKDKWTLGYDSVGMCPYASRADQWFGYDDVKSLTAKVSWLKQRGYGGAMVWTLDHDDWRGACGKKNPLLETLANNLQGYLVPSYP